MCIFRFGRERLIASGWKHPRRARNLLSERCFSQRHNQWLASVQQNVFRACLRNRYLAASPRHQIAARSIVERLMRRSMVAFRARAIGTSVKRTSSTLVRLQLPDPPPCWTGRGWSGAKSRTHPEISRTPKTAFTFHILTVNPVIG